MPEPLARAAVAEKTPRTCRLCGAPLHRTFVDLGVQPPCESYLKEGDLDSPEAFYPLHVRICDNCLLVQLPAYVAAEDIFSDYAYFSSYSDSWVRHAETYVEQMATRLSLGPTSLVTEVASNDGYLLQHVVRRGIPVLGVEPAANVAEVARARGVRTAVRFLGEKSGLELADEFGRADLVAGNNVFAHVPDIVGFAKGLRNLVADDGLVTLEFPHLLRLIGGRQYDTIYHEHFSYLSLLTASRALEAGGLQVVDVEELKTHGGSLRVHARLPAAAEPPSAAVDRVLDEERAFGLHSVEGYAGFAEEVLKVKCDLLDFLVSASRAGKSVVGYGAPGKGNTLLNHCGIRSDLMAFTVDRSPHKQGLFLPGTHIPILSPDQLATTRPDYIVILPWNLRVEIMDQLQYARAWGARFVVPIPELDIG